MKPWNQIRKKQKIESDLIGNLALIPNDMNPQKWNPLNPQSIRKLTQESQDQVNGWRI